MLQREHRNYKLKKNKPTKNVKQVKEKQTIETRNGIYK